jgi:adenylylsulfate kinase-like enzyme
MVLWFTGISGAGKSSIAKELEKKLWEEGKQTVLLDGDQVRHGLNGDLGFSPKTVKRIYEEWEKWPAYSLNMGILCSVRLSPPTKRIVKPFVRSSRKENLWKFM